MMLRIFLFILFTIVALSSNAQFSVGVRGGFGAHGVYFEHPSMNNYQEPFYRANGGFVLIYNNDNNAGLQTEINYSQKGWQELPVTKKDSFFYREINYLEIPFFSHFEMGFGKVRPIIFGGPYIGWKLSEKTDSLNWGHLWYPEHRYLHYEQDIRDLDYGIKLGLGLRYNINNRFAIYIDARYDLQMAGGRDIFKDHPNDIQASRLTEISGSFGILWHLIPQKRKEEKKGYVPKEDLFEAF